LNVAFPAVVALILVLPGLIVLRVRRRKPGTPELFPPAPTPLSTDAALALVFAAVVQVVWYGATTPARFLLSDAEVRFDIVFKLLTGQYGTAASDVDAVVNSVTWHPLYIVLYFSGMYVFSAAVGFRFGREIDDGLTRAGLLSSAETKTPEGQSVLVTAVVEMGGTAYLFAGQLLRLYYNRSTHELERVVLADVMKRPLLQPTPEREVQLPRKEPEFEEVFGDEFVIRASELKTLNFVYVGAKVAESEPHAL
jgi:hypothetical protein